MEQEGSLLCSQQPVTSLYPEPEKSLQFYEGIKRFSAWDMFVIRQEYINVLKDK